MTEINVPGTKEQIKALVLLSGGLDSQLAVCVLREQGIGVAGISFESPFFSADKARIAAEHLGITLHVEEFTDDIIALVRHPPHGFGANMNPCIDCHAAMLRKAGGLMGTLHAHFLATGEVLNERPMSQNMRALSIVAAASGFAGLVVRPLSAQLLPETEPERLKWIARDKLLALYGRGRNAQMELAKKYGLKDFPLPAGGCRLTDPNFSRRLKDLRKLDGLGDTRSVVLLKYGRHFRLGPATKLIVGRHESDNSAIEKFADRGSILLTTEDVPGPVALLDGNADEATILRAAAICARYGDFAAGNPAKIRVRSSEFDRMLDVIPASPEDVEKQRV